MNLNCYEQGPNHQDVANPATKKSGPESKGPSIYDVHTEGGWGHAQVDACGRGGSSPMWTSTQKMKIRVH